MALLKLYLVFLLCIIDTDAYICGQCTCIPQRKLISCSSRNLVFYPHVPVSDLYQQIDLRNNRVFTSPPLHYLQHFRLIDLRGNPMECSGFDLKWDNVLQDSCNTDFTPSKGSPSPFVETSIADIGATSEPPVTTSSTLLDANFTDLPHLSNVTIVTWRNRPHTVQIPRSDNRKIAPTLVTLHDPVQPLLPSPQARPIATIVFSSTGGAVTFIVFITITITMCRHRRRRRAKRETHMASYIRDRSSRARNSFNSHCSDSSGDYAIIQRFTPQPSPPRALQAILHPIDITPLAIANIPLPSSSSEESMDISITRTVEPTVSTSPPRPQSPCTDITGATDPGAITTPPGPLDSVEDVSSRRGRSRQTRQSTGVRRYAPYTPQRTSIRPTQSPPPAPTNVARGIKRHALAGCEASKRQKPSP